MSFVPPPAGDPRRSLRDALAREIEAIDAQIAALADVARRRDALAAELASARAQRVADRTEAVATFAAGLRPTSVCARAPGEPRPRRCGCGVTLVDPRSVSSTADAIATLIGRGARGRSLVLRSDGLLALEICAPVRRRRRALASVARLAALALTLGLLTLGAMQALAPPPAAHIVSAGWTSMQ